MERDMIRKVVKQPTIWVALALNELNCSVKLRSGVLVSKRELFK